MTTSIERAGTEFGAFVSYSSRQRPAAIRIHRFLESALRGAQASSPDVYLDQEDIRGGHLSQELASALARSRALIVLCTRTAPASEWVKLEIETYRQVRPDGAIIPILLDGEPGTSIPPSISVDQYRFHDLRSGLLFGVLKPAARAELLRIVAKLTDRDLKDLIDWDRRRIVKRLVYAGAVVSAAGAAGSRAYLDATEIEPADIAATVTYSWSTDPLEVGPNKRLNDVLSAGATLELRSVARADQPPGTGWPGIARFRLGAGAGDDAFVERDGLLLKGPQTSARLFANPSVDGPNERSERTFAALTGSVGAMRRRWRWSSAIFEACVDVNGEDIRFGEAWDGAQQADLTARFDDRYGITPADRDKFVDYSVQPLPISVVLVVYVRNVAVWESDALVARVWEHDEDVRKLHRVYFPPDTDRRRDKGPI